MMLATCNLHVEYGHCTVNQMYEKRFKQCCSDYKALMSFVSHPLHNHQNYGG